MASLGQVRGMLLEEIVLRFLEANGYTAIDTAGSDPTLIDGHSGLEVRGRATPHQIDAIANYRFTPPFSHPYRLLVEAKSLDKPVGLNVIRNALGVLRDVSEYWNSKDEPRFHYQYAVFTDTRFTEPAQTFGYVQDIFLLPLAKARSMAPVLEALRAIGPEDVTAIGGASALKNVRTAFRAALRNGGVAMADIGFSGALLAAAQHVGQALIGMTLNGLPLFLVPSDGVDVTTLQDQEIRVMWNDESWYIESLENRRLFSFDLPEQLFDLYAKRGQLTERRALNLKQEALAEIQATVFNGSDARVLRFVLDIQWIETVRAQIEERRSRSPRPE